MENYKQKPTPLSDVACIVGRNNPNKITTTIPKVEMVSLDSLVIDYSYQRVVRAEGRKNIKQIIEGFDWRHFQPLLVSPVEVDGKLMFTIIDGQHRALAAFHHPDVKEVPAAIVPTEFNEQARVFVEINTQVVKMKPLEMWWAEYHAQRTEALEVAELIHSAGYTVAKTMPYDNFQPGQIDSHDGYEDFLREFSGKVWLPKEVWRICARHSYENVLCAMRFIKCGESHDPRVVNSCALEAVAYFFKRNSIGSYDVKTAQSYSDHINYWEGLDILEQVASDHRDKRKPFEVYHDLIFKPFWEKHCAGQFKRIA